MFAGSQKQQQRSAVCAAAEAPARGAGACRSGAQRAVEDRARQQRVAHQQAHLCAEWQRREAVAATVNHAYRAALEQRERQRRAAADAVASHREQWAAGAGLRHGTAPGGMRHACFDGAGGASTGAYTATTAAAAGAFGGSGGGDGAATAPQGRDARFWMLYALAYRRLYGTSAPADADDCWGRMATAAAAAAADGADPADFFGGSAGELGGQQQGHSCFCDAATSAYAYWRDFAKQAAVGFRFKSYGGGADDGSAAGPRQQQQRRQQQQQPATAVPPPSSPAGANVELQVRAELAALLAASGGDLAAFVSALGIPFERSQDAAHTAKNARRAAMLSLHPDRLLHQGAHQQAWGHHATTLVNELWRASWAA